MKIRANIDITHYDGSKIKKGTLKNLDSVKNQTEKDFLKRRLRDGDFTVVAEVEKKPETVTVEKKESYTEEKYTSKKAKVIKEQE